MKLILFGILAAIGRTILELFIVMTPGEGLITNFLLLIMLFILDKETESEAKSWPLLK